MVTDRKLTIETFSTKLGARKLAELLITEAAGNRRLKQTLNLATSTQDGPAALGAIVRRRLVTLAKSRSMLPYDKGRELIAELDGLRTTIIETIAPKDFQTCVRTPLGVPRTPSCLGAAKSFGGAVDPSRPVWS